MSTARTSPWLIASRALALASLAVLVVSFATAGVLLQDHRAEDVHGTAAIVLHVVTGALAIAMLGSARTTPANRWPAAVAVLAFGYTFLQAWWGAGMTLYLHVPGALLLTTAVVWLCAWTWQRR